MYSTYPDYETLCEYHDKTPAYMYPNKDPYVVIYEGLLSEKMCREIIDLHDDVDSYGFKGCNAFTKETPRLAQSDGMQEIRMSGEFANSSHWKYALEGYPRAWLQTYSSGGSYQMHMDGAPGQSRKLTAVALLSDQDAYVGGDLEIHVTPNVFTVPRTRGTVVVFPPWILHQVTPIVSGVRQTINMGFWGPPFK